MKLYFNFILLLFLFSCFAFGHTRDINFVENKGQWSDQVNFKSNALGGQEYFKKGNVTVIR